MIDIAVVTSVWGDYGKYLPDWAWSIIGQTRPPKQVAIHDAGLTDYDGFNEAVDILEGFTDTQDVKLALTGDRYNGMGAARNAAVASTSTEWVMHLDADDELLPTAIADVDAVHEGHDVVSLGAVEEGRGKATVFTDISAEQILQGRHCIYSCGAFRREFWERRPFHTQNDWVDSVFWVGLAHLGARFTTTGKVGFFYTQHPDSISHSLTVPERQAALRQWKRACIRWHLS